MGEHDRPSGLLRTELLGVQRDAVLDGDAAFPTDRPQLG
jgi:hypothetical protein